MREMSGLCRALAADKVRVGLKSRENYESKKYAANPAVGGSVNECRVLPDLTDLLNRGIFYRCFDKTPFFVWLGSVDR